MSVWLYPRPSYRLCRFGGSEFGVAVPAPVGKIDPSVWSGWRETDGTMQPKGVWARCARSLAWE